MFRDTFYSPLFNLQKRQIFFETVRWHSNPINSRWHEVERRAMRSLSRYLDVPGLAPNGAARQTLLRSVMTIERLRRTVRLILVGAWQRRKLIVRALRGNPAALRWMWWAAKGSLAYVRGVAFEDLRPDVPRT